LEPGLSWARPLGCTRKACLSDWAQPDWFTCFHSLACTVRPSPCRPGLPDAALFCLVDVCAQPGQEKMMIGCPHLLEVIRFFSLHARPCTLRAHSTSLARGIRSIRAFLRSLALEHSLHVQSLTLQLRQPNKGIFSYGEGLVESGAGTQSDPKPTIHGKKFYAAVPHGARSATPPRWPTRVQSKICAGQPISRAGVISASRMTWLLSSSARPFR